MEEKLISFGTSKLAKEKGFNIPVLNCYNENNELGDVDDLLYIDYNKFDVVYGSNTNMYSVPTQSLLQKWLREKHSLYILLEETETLSLDSGIGFYYKIIKVKDKEHLRLDYSMYFYKTYEEALEVGLKEGLQLI